MQGLLWNVCKQLCAFSCCRAWDGTWQTSKLALWCFNMLVVSLDRPWCRHRFAAWKSLERCAVCFEPFRQYFNHMGCQSVYWRYSPVHLEDAWGRFQLAVVEAWEIAGVDGTAILQKIRSRYETRAPFRSASLQRWEREHMAKEDKRYKNRQTAIKSLERWERRQMARQDKNKHRPKKLRERNPTGRLERWERRQMAMQDKNRHRPQKLRERNPTGRLERWERRQMAMQDKNKHRPKKLRERNPTGRLERWERRQMAMQDKNTHRPRSCDRICTRVSPVHHDSC